MARPLKRTVDYFPHSCNHRETMFILEERYGNDGYAFWFKLLELLGNSPGHYLVYRAEKFAGWEFLVAKTHLTADKCQNILDLLAKLEAIDRELWQTHRVVWCQKFVDGIADAYRDRKVELPSKPSFQQEKPTPSSVSGAGNLAESANLVPENHKLNKTRLKDKQPQQSFEEYKQELRERFKDLDFDVELEKFNLYWKESNRKLKNPKLALLNWMTKAQRWAEEHKPTKEAVEPVRQAEPPPEEFMRRPLKTERLD